MTDLDHLVYGVPDLPVGVREFTAATGIEPVPGGRHTGYGTANYLVGLGNGRYLEIIGVDPDGPDTPSRRLFGIDRVRPAGLLTWAVRTDNIDLAIETARRDGYDPGGPVELSRRTTGGDVLRWQLTPDTIDATGGIVPFLIDWGESTHPTQYELPELELASLTLCGPGAGRLDRHLAALRVPIPVHEAARPGMRAVLATPNGVVTLD
ncbi:MAG TPA: VOC family protein [Mycobacteriales bacterium]